MVIMMGAGLIKSNGMAETKNLLRFGLLDMASLYDSIALFLSWDNITVTGSMTCMLPPVSHTEWAARNPR